LFIALLYLVVAFNVYFSILAEVILAKAVVGTVIAPTKANAATKTAYFGEIMLVFSE